MNERMIELAKEADILEWEVLPWNKDARTPNHESAAKVTKFAKLIVQECVEQVFVSIPDTMCAASGAYKTARLAAINNIKEHFGVE